MAMFHFFNCAILTFAPHAVYFSATPLSKYDTLGKSVKAALVYLGTELVKLLCLATFLNVSESDSFDPYQGLQANANLFLSISLAALGSLMWLRKNKPKTLIPMIYMCALIVATMPSITSYLRRGMGWHFPKVVGFELFTSMVMAFVSWQLFSACQRPFT